MRRCLILFCLALNLSAINITKVAAGTTILVNVLDAKNTIHKIRRAAHISKLKIKKVLKPHATS